MSVFILKYYTVIPHDNRDIIWYSYKEQIIGYFESLDILKFTVNKSNNKIQLYEGDEMELENENHLRYFKYKMNTLLDSIKEDEQKE